MSVESEMRIDQKQVLPRPFDPTEKATFDWGDLVLHSVHPVKVAIVETLLRLQKPLSASRLEQVLRGTGYSVGVISHHVRGLADWGALELVETKQVGGAIEKTYFLASRVKQVEPGPDPQPELAKAVRSLREDKGLSQAALAKKSGITTSDLAEVESGEVDPTWARMQSIASGLGIPWELLADLAHPSDEQEPDEAKSASVARSGRPTNPGGGRL